MALATREGGQPLRQQAPSPGVGRQGAPPVVEPLPAPEPVLFEDIDPVLLVRLYPDAASVDELRSQAMQAGQAAKEQGAELVASQQEPVIGAGEEPVQQPQYPERPPPPPTQYPYPPQAGQYNPPPQQPGWQPPG